MFNMTVLTFLSVSHLWFYCRQDAAKRQTAGIKFTHRPKIQKISIFAPQVRLVAPIHTKFGTSEGHAGPPGRVQFHANRCSGWERGPQNGKNFHFFIESRAYSGGGEPARAP